MAAKEWVMSFILKGKKARPPVAAASLFENFIAAQDEAAVVGGDGVDDDFGALRHFDGLGAGEFALIIFAVADHDDGLARGMVGTVALRNDLIFASAVDGVVERGATAILQVCATPAESSFTLSVKSCDIWLLVLKPTMKALSKLGRIERCRKLMAAFLLEIETAVHRAADVDEQAECRWVDRFRGGS
jgi:hypothetical protein